MVVPKDYGIDDLKQFTINVIRSSGEEALSYYGKGNPCVKFDEGLVTEAELLLTGLFQDKLQAHFPEHQMFKNNQEDKEYTHESKRYLWVYDALDGVANFQTGIPTWGISLALLENFWPVLGAFYMPVTGDLFYAQAGRKAFWGEEAVRVSSQENINDESILLTFSRFHYHYNSTFPGKIRNMGSTIAHMCYVAKGSAEAAIVANESYQDLAAASIIVEAAGGKIFRMNGGEFSLNEYLDGRRIGDHLLVAAPETFSQVRQYLTER